MKVANSEKRGGQKAQVDGDVSADGMSPTLIKALNHPLRRQILRSLNEREDPRSPAQLERALGLSLSSLSYHMRVLKGLGAVRLTRTKQVRGALEHFFVSTVVGNKEVVSILAATEAADKILWQG